MKARFNRTIRCDFFLRFRWKKRPPPIRPEVMVLAQVMFRCRTGFLYRTAEMLSEKYVEWTNDMAVGPTRTSWLCHGERRQSRHGVNTSLSAQPNGVNTSLDETRPITLHR